VGPLEFALGRAGAVLMVADGMGGRAGGERASARAVTAVAETMVHGAGDGASPQNFVRRLGEALDSANRMIHDEGMSADAYRGMGTTATLAGLLGGNVYVAQVGDSRAYLARGGELTRLTRDQSLVQDMIDMGILSEEEAQSVPSNQILQALGVAPTVEPAVTYHELRRGDLLLLCSDGLSGVVSDAELRGAVADATECAAICDRLVALANERGGPDNITVIAARIDGDGIETATTRDRIVARRYPGS
jgi:protein phosphatase